MGDGQHGSAGLPEPAAGALEQQWTSKPQSDLRRLPSTGSFCRTTNPASPGSDTGSDVEDDDAEATGRMPSGGAAAAFSSPSQPHQPQHAPSAPSFPPNKHAAFHDWPTDGGRYEYLQWLGNGSYAEVAEARDRRTGQRVAVKRMRDALRLRCDALHVYREVLLLSKLSSSSSPIAMGADGGGSSGGRSSGHGHGQGHPNLVRLVDVILPASYSEFDELVLVFEAADTNLGSLLASPQQLHDGHVVLFLYQILRGLRHLHEAGVVHRDIKPQNVLAHSDCSLKLCDLGLSRVLLERPLSARFHHPQQQPPQPPPPQSAASLLAAAMAVPPARLAREQTMHVVTRWYRAPEVILGQPYTAQMDMWSVGCLAAELLAKAQQPARPVRPLFPGRGCFPLTRQTGPEPGDQLATIFRVLGGGPGPHTMRSLGLSPPLRAHVAHMAGMAHHQGVPLIPPAPAAAAVFGAAAGAEAGAVRMEVVPAEDGREESKGQSDTEEDGAEEEARVELWRTTEMLRRRFPDANPLGLDLVARMLAIDPARRITCAAALQHPYLKRAETYCLKQEQRQQGLQGGGGDSHGTRRMPPHAVAAALWSWEELAVLQDGHDLSGEQIREGLWEALHALRAANRKHQQAQPEPAAAAVPMAVDAGC